MKNRFAIFIIGSILIFYFFTLLVPKKPQVQTIASSAPTARVTEPTAAPLPAALPQVEIEETPVEIDNQKLKIRGTNYNGVLKNILVHGYTEVTGPVDLVTHVKENEFFRLELIQGAKPVFGETTWTLSTEKNILAMEKLHPGRWSVIKRLIMDPGRYTGQIELEIKNLGQKSETFERASLAWGPVQQVDKDIPEIVIFDQGKMSRITPGKSHENRSVHLEKGWVGLKNNYFCMLFFSPENPLNAIAIRSADKTLTLNLVFNDLTLPAGGTFRKRIGFYIGPQDYTLLKQAGHGLHKVVDFGWFHYIGLMMLYILKYFYMITKNYGVAIILLTLLIRVLLWWPTQKSYTSMKTMQKSMNLIQPRLKTLKEVYRNDPQKLNEETMKLYREYKINPAGGCLPMLLQMPILFALWQTLTKAVELKGAGFAWIWKDLSLKDPMYILPIVMGISMFVQQKMTNTPAATPEAAQQQQIMLYIMPIFLTVISLWLPSGVLLYWVVSNLFGIAQQIYINRVA